MSQTVSEYTDAMSKARIRENGASGLQDFYRRMAEADGGPMASPLRFNHLVRDC